MKLHADRTESTTITAHGAGWVAVNGERFYLPVLVSSEMGVCPWQCTSVTGMESADFAALLEFATPELVIVGCGTRQHLFHPKKYEALIQRGIGLESMDTPAACRTYNILASEGRRVLAALFVGATDAATDAGGRSR